MSSRKRQLVVTERAKGDFQSIRMYTRRELGIEQAIRYMSAIDRAFVKIKDNPELGRMPFEHRQEFRCTLAGSHYIYYRITDVKIEIVRILHERADAPRHL